MYVVPINVAPSESAVRDFINANPFGTLTSLIEGELVASHLIFQMVEEGDEVVLYSHMAAANGQTKSIRFGTDHLCVFMNQHAYISSSWYGHTNVPSWNYISVHCYGKPQVLNDKEAFELLNKLTISYEHGREGAFSMSQMSEESLQSHIKGQLSFRMVVERVDASWKLSQNRNDADYSNVITQLRSEGDAMSALIADEMQRLRE